MRTNTVYAESYPQEVRAAIYCRLSKDDDLSGPSAVVLTKDLSRLGRNHLQVGQLLEDFFPR